MINHLTENKWMYAGRLSGAALGYIAGPVGGASVGYHLGSYLGSRRDFQERNMKMISHRSRRLYSRLRSRKIRRFGIRHF